MDDYYLPPVSILKAKVKKKNKKLGMITIQNLSTNITSRYVYPFFQENMG